MNITELIEKLTELAEAHGPETTVRFAHQPQWAFEYSIGEVVGYDPSEDEEEEDPKTNPEWGSLTVGEQAALGEQYEAWKAANPPVVYIAEGTQLGYLPGAASRLLGWR